MVLMKEFLIFVFIVLFSAQTFAEINIIYPIEASLVNGASIQIGEVSPAQTFEIFFSDNSGRAFEWDTIEVDSSTMPLGWAVISTEKTKSSLSAKIKIPKSAKLNFYNIKFIFSNSQQPSVVESVTIRVTLKENLLDVSFVKKPGQNFSVVGEPVIYTAIISNSSIASHSINFTSDLSPNWFDKEKVIAKPNSSEEIILEVVPNAYGKKSFTFVVNSAEKNSVLTTFSSELNVRPTLKGKFASSLSGFPFFSFALIPFEMLNSIISLVIPA